MLHVFIYTYLNSLPIQWPLQLLAHHHLCYIDIYYVFDSMFVFSLILLLFLYYVFWTRHSHWLNWSHEYFVRYVIFGPTFLCLFFVICYL